METEKEQEKEEVLKHLTGVKEEKETRRRHFRSEKQ